MQQYIPYAWQEINNLAGHYSPSGVKPFNNLTYAYWERSLYQRAVSRIKSIVPENWEGKVKDFLLLCLLRNGFVFVSKNDTLGYWFNPGSLYGVSFYYQPTDFILANPHASEVGIQSKGKNNRFKLGEEGQLLKFLPDYKGIFDVISFYAEKLSSLDSAVNMAIINSKVPFILGARNKATATTLKAIFDRVNSGEPAVVYDQVLKNDPEDRESPFQLLELQKIKDNYILDKLLQEYQTILNMYDAEIGINTLPYTKAERFVSAEANARKIDSQARITTAIECLQSSVEDIKKLYPDINLSFELREDDIEDDTTEEYYEED